MVTKQHTYLLKTRKLKAQTVFSVVVWSVNKQLGWRKVQSLIKLSFAEATERRLLRYPALRTNEKDEGDRALIRAYGVAEANTSSREISFHYVKSWFVYFFSLFMF